MSDIRISTITKVGRLSKSFNLKDLFENILITEEITYVEYGDMPTKGTNPKKENINKKKSKKPPSTKKRKNYFYNQLSLLVYYEKYVSVKIFNNGSIQMTGIKNDRMSYGIVDILIKNISDIYPDESIKILDFKTVMVNSDFDLKFTINNDALHELIEKSNYYSSYEPCTYPGVNIKYYFNNNQKTNLGICQCHGVCDGKGLNGNCKRITIAAFKSGKVIITGGRTLEQVYIAKDFITKFIYNNKQSIQLDYLKHIIIIQRYYKNRLKKIQS